MFENIKNGFKEIIMSESEKSYYKNLMSFIAEEQSRYTVFPEQDKIYSAFQYVNLEDVRVVIIGQDPYHGEGQANGLAFSVYENVKTPPSLRNIIKEIKRDCKVDNDRSNNLSDLAIQGVLLINSVLTVRKDTAGSHRNKGWEIFTDTIIKEVSDSNDNVVFMLWGKDAEKKKMLIDETKHKILITSHPSPLSARRGFEGCSHFSLANEYLIHNGKTPIKWI